MRSRLHRYTRFMVGFVPVAVVLSGCGSGRVRCRPTTTEVAVSATVDARPGTVGDSSRLAATLWWSDGTLARTTLVFAMVVRDEVRVLGTARTDARGTALFNLTEDFKRDPQLAFAREARAAFRGGNGWCPSKDSAPYHFAQTPAGPVDSPVVPPPLPSPVASLLRSVPPVPTTPPTPLCLPGPLRICLPAAA